MTNRVESDQWGPGPSIVAEETLTKLRAALKQTSLIVEHWFYRAATGPERHVFDEFEDLETYLKANAKPGDLLYAWRFDLCRRENALAYGKIPDWDGAVPKGGAY